MTELFCSSGCILGEGSFWHEEHVWCVDAEGGLLLSITAAGKISSRFSLNKRIEAAVPLDSHELLLAVENEIVQAAMESGNRRTIARLDDMPEDTNFGRCGAGIHAGAHSVAVKRVPVGTLYAAS